MMAFCINGKSKSLSELFMTHPPLDKRIEALRTGEYLKYMKKMEKRVLIDALFMPWIVALKPYVNHSHRGNHCQNSRSHQLSAYHYHRTDLASAPPVPRRYSDPVDEPVPNMPLAPPLRSRGAEVIMVWLLGDWNKPNPAPHKIIGQIILISAGDAAAEPGKKAPQP